MSEDLIIIENLDPGELFAGNGLDELLEAVSKQVKKFVPDVSTALGRKDLGSFSYKITRSRTALDKLAKDYVAGKKLELKKFDAHRKKAREYLEDLETNARKPLTDWETADAKRSQDIVDRVQAIKDMVPTEAYVIENTRIEVFDERLRELQEMTIGDDFEELTDIAITTRDEAITALAAIVDRLETQISEKAELDRLRKESEAQRQKDHNAEVARNATIAAEARMADEKQKAIDAQVAAEKRAAEAEANAKLEIQAALDRVAAGEAAEKEATRKRETNTRHKGKIHSEIVAKLVELNFVAHEDDGKSIVKAMAKSILPHVTINY